MVTCVTISPNFASPEGEGFQPSPMGTLNLPLLKIETFGTFTFLRSDSRERGGAARQPDQELAEACPGQRTERIPKEVLFGSVWPPQVQVRRKQKNTLKVTSISSARFLCPTSEQRLEERLGEEPAEITVSLGGGVPPHSGKGKSWLTGHRNRHLLSSLSPRQAFFSNNLEGRLPRLWP